MVNDLDVTVRGPGAAPVYLGNVFSGGWSATGGSADRRNNVENVYIQSAGAGTWTTGELSNTSFRVRVIDVASSTARDLSLDWVAVQVTYQP